MMLTISFVWYESDLLDYFQARILRVHSLLHTLREDVDSLYEYCYVRQYGGKSFKMCLSSISCLGVMLLHLLCVLRYTTARLQVLFSSHHLGRITKGCSNNYDSESLLLYLHLLTLTQLYSNLVYNECNTTYLCLVLVVLVSPKISRVRLALLCTLLLSPVASALLQA